MTGLARQIIDALRPWLEAERARVQSLEDRVPADPAVMTASALSGEVYDLPAGTDFVEMTILTVGNPAAIVPNVARVRGSVVGAIKTDGVGADLRLVELHDDGTKLVLSSVPYALPDTAGAWQTFGFTTDTPPTAGRHQYVVEGRKNGVLTAQIRAPQVALVRLPG